MRILIISIFFSFHVAFGASLSTSDTTYYELWDISNLELIGGHDVRVTGDPEVVCTDIGDAVYFDGEADQLLVDFNPIMDAREFTVELVFKPDASYPDNVDPRFLHIQDPDDPEEKRVMIELRINENNQCYMDGYMNTDLESLALKDESLIHPTETWQHVAITYKDSILTTYFNGTKELSGTVNHSNAIVNIIGKTSLGARMNEVKYYSGLIKTFKVTHACLEPEDFIFIHDDVDTTFTNVLLLKRDDGMEVFPNPVDQVLNLKMGYIQNRTCVEVCILDASGKICHRQKSDHVFQDILTFDSSEFQNGVYFIKYKSNNQTDYRKIVVMH